MTDYSSYPPPIQIAAATASLLDKLQGFDAFSMRFNARWSFGDFASHLDKAPDSTPWVDVVPPVKPTSDLDGRYWYKHGVPIRVGVRAKLKDVTVDWSEAIDPVKIAAYVKLLYEIKDYFDPSSTNPRGQALKDDIPGAIVQRGCTIIKEWDPELLVAAKVYCGIIEVPFALKVSRTTDFPDDGSGVDPGSNWEPWFGLPRGGVAGQVLTKVDATDYRSHWEEPANPAVLTLPAGESLGGHRAVRVSAGSLWYASSDDPVASLSTVGITSGAAASGADASAVTLGPIVEPSWNWTPGPVFLGTAGALTQTPPSSGLVLQVGLAESPTTIFVCPKQPIRKL